MLCVLDASSGTDVGGTRATYERWRKTVGAARVIDLAALRSGSEASAPQGGARLPEQSVDDQKPTDDKRLPRSLKAMMFADFAGFSRVQDAFAPQFQDQFLRVAAAQIGESPVRPLDAKTWGDGLYVVFDAPQYAAEFALGFLERAQDVDWTTTGLRSTSPVRIALHAGPVFRGFDPVMQREHYFGSSVTRAARIEPITQPGTVYASEAFAATIAAAGRKDFALEYIGRVALAKHYGESTIYRLDRQ
jgi:class 3 adenylate cyclase